MGKKSRDKGSRGQREVAALLKPWWGAEFASTPMSGGFHTKKFREDWNAAADIVTPDDSFPFSVEVKWQEGWVLDELLTAPRTKIWEWWGQCVRECPAGKIPLLVFKRNRKPWMFMLFQADMPLVNPLGCLQLRDPTKAFVYVGLFEDFLLTTKKEIWLKKSKMKSPM